VQTFTPEFIDAARPARHITGDRWFVDETYVKVAGRWMYLYRAVDQHGQVIDVLVSARRNAEAARAFFARALQRGPARVEVTTHRAPVYPRVLDEAVPTAQHITERYANNVIEADHGRLKARLRPMRGLKRLASARIIAAGHAFVQNLRRGHYAITSDLPAHDRVRVVRRTRRVDLTVGLGACRAETWRARLDQRNSELTEKAKAHLRHARHLRQRRADRNDSQPPKQ
jgi:transposase-like protein